MERKNTKILKDAILKERRDIVNDLFKRLQRDIESINRNDAILESAAILIRLDGRRLHNLDRIDRFLDDFKDHNVPLNEVIDYIKYDIYGRD